MTDIQAGVGVSQHRNPKVAGRTAVEQALQQAGLAQDRPDFVFMFASVGYNQAALLNAVRQASQQAPLCGCSVEGVITRGVAEEVNFAVIVMVIKSSALQFSHGVARGLKADSQAVGQAIAQAIQPQLRDDTKVLFLLPDGLTCNYSALAEGLETTLIVDQPLPFVGGLAGDNHQFKQTYQYYNDQVISDGVAWALLSGQAEVTWGISHGCVPVGIEHVITRAEGNLIYEVDGRPILDLFREDYLTKVASENWLEIMQTFTIGLKMPGFMAADYDNYIIRALVGGFDETTSAVTLSTEVPTGTSIWVAHRDYDKLVAGVERTLTKITNHMAGQPAKLAFQFECAGRGQVFLRQQQKLDLLQIIGQEISPPTPWIGFYAFGEIGPVGTTNAFHNDSMVLVTIY